MLREEDQKLLLGLVKRNIVTNSQLQDFIVSSESSINLQGIVQTLVRNFNIPEDQLSQVIAEEFNIPFLYATEGQNWVEVSDLPEEASSKYRFIPIIVEDLEITVAFIDPPYKRIINLIETTTRREVVPVVITVTAFDTLITKKSKKFGKESASRFNFEALDVEVRGEKWANSIESATKFPPATVIFSKIIEASGSFKTTEIHIETAHGGHLNIRFRIEGILQRVVTLPKRLTSSIFNIIEQSHMLTDDYSNSEFSGEMTYKLHNKKINFKYRIIETIQGKKAILFIPQSELEILTIDDLGYSENDLKRLNFLMSRNPGIVLIAGAKATGKTTTMLSILKTLETEQYSIFSMDDVVHNKFNGITQVEPKKSTAQERQKSLKNILEFVPDFFFLDEIKKIEELDILNDFIPNNIKVFSTYKALDAIKTILHIKKISNNFEEIIGNIHGVVAQKIVRKVCTNCSIDYRPDEDILESGGLINLPEEVYLSRGEGCGECTGTGYNKILPLVEVLIMTDELRTLFLQDASYNKILDEAKKTGFTTMRYDGIRKALRGVTTLDEILRVT